MKQARLPGMRWTRIRPGAVVVIEGVWTTVVKWHGGWRIMDHGAGFRSWVRSFIGSDHGTHDLIGPALPWQAKFVMRRKP